MTHFPVSSSILSPAHLALFLQEAYQLSKNTQCSLLRAGINHSYVVTDGSEKFVFRIYSLNWRTITEISEEIRLLNLLRETVSISYPLQDANNRYIQVLNAPEGERYGVLFSYAKGEKLHVYSEETHFRIGTIMARIHETTHKLSLQRATYDPQTLLIGPLKELSKFLSADSAEMDFMRSAQAWLLQELLNVAVEKLRTGAVHLDIWFDNLNITKENEITIFDFDFCGNGWLCLDLAYYVLQVNSIERDEKECKLKVDAFLRGYESVTQLPAEEKRILPMLGVCLYFFYLGIQCQRFDNWSNSFLNENYLKRFINVLVKRYFDLNKLGEK